MFLLKVKRHLSSERAHNPLLVAIVHVLRNISKGGSGSVNVFINLGAVMQPWFQVAFCMLWFLIAIQRSTVVYVLESGNLDFYFLWSKPHQIHVSVNLCGTVILWGFDQSGWASQKFLPWSWSHQKFAYIYASMYICMYLILYIVVA